VVVEGTDASSAAIFASTVPGTDARTAARAWSVGIEPNAFGSSCTNVHGPASRSVAWNQRPATRKYQSSPSLNRGLSVLLTHCSPSVPAIDSSFGLPSVTINSVGRSA
jgi:hypothetical protein